MSNDFLDIADKNIFYDLANNISHMVWIADEQGKIIWSNKRWQHYTGMSAEEEDWLHLYHPEEVKLIKGELRKNEPQENSWEGTYRIKNKHGKYSWFLTRVVPSRDEKTNQLLWFASHTNINRLLELESNLSNEKALLMAVIDKIPAMVTIYDPLSMKINLNPAFVNNTGWTNEDAREKNIMELVYPDPDYRREVMEFMNKRGPFFKDIDMVTKDGRLLKTSWANELLNDGRQVGIGIDITLRKKMEEEIQDANQQLLNLNQLMENLLYMAAHDLKSPLANLNLIMTLMGEEDDLEEKQSYVPKIATMIQRLEGVVDGLSEFIESQQQKNDLLVDIDLAKLSEDIINDFRREINDQDIEVNITNEISQIQYECPVLKNILKNLISNAIKYAHPGRKPVINIKWQSYGSNFVLLTIADNGIGIDLDKYGHKLFRPFKRFSSQAWGSGIGLFIVKNFVERNGGFIKVESLPEQGTTFLCYLKAGHH